MIEPTTLLALLPFVNQAFIFVLGLLVSLLIWLGKKVDSRLDDINASIKETNKTLVSIELDLRRDLSNIDKRVTVIETLQERN